MRHKINMALGLFISVLPFLGFPRSWDDLFIIVCGLSIAFLSFISFIVDREKSIKKNENSEPELE